MSDKTPDLKSFQHYMDRQEMILAALYQLTQQKEAEKISDDWQPHYILLNTPEPIQIIGRSKRRSSLSIYNAGPSAIAYSNVLFEETATLAQYLADSYNVSLPIGILASGASVNADTRGAIYAWNLNYGAGSPAAGLTIIEGLYSIPDTPIPDPKHQPRILSEAEELV